MENLLKAEKANPLGDDAAQEAEDGVGKKPRRAAVARGDAECDHARPGEERETSATESTGSSGARGDHARSRVVRAMSTKAEMRDAHRGGGDVGAHRVVEGRQGDAVAKRDIVHDRQGDAVRRRAAVAAAGRRSYGKSMSGPPSSEQRANQRDFATGEQRFRQSMPPSSKELMNQKDGAARNGERIGTSIEDERATANEDFEQRLKHKRVEGRTLSDATPQGRNISHQRFGKSMVGPPSHGERMNKKMGPQRHHSYKEKMNQKLRSSTTQGSDTNGDNHRSANGQRKNFNPDAMADGNVRGNGSIRSLGSNFLSVTDQEETDASDLDALERDLARSNENVLRSFTKRSAAVSGKGHRSMSMTPSHRSGDKRHGGHNDLRSSGSFKGSHSDHRRSTRKHPSAATKGDHGDSLRSSRSSNGSHGERSRSRNKGSHNGVTRPSSSSVDPAGNGHRNSTTSH